MPKGTLVPPYSVARAPLYAVESGQRDGGEEAERMAKAEAAGRPHLLAPAGAGAVAVGRIRGVPAQAGDHREDVLAIRVDADPGAAPAASPAHEAGRVE